MRRSGIVGRGRDALRGLAVAAGCSCESRFERSAIAKIGGRMNKNKINLFDLTT
jgi:hypothetical protein